MIPAPTFLSQGFLLDPMEVSHYPSIFVVVPLTLDTIQYWVKRYSVGLQKGKTLSPLEGRNLMLSG